MENNLFDDISFFDDDDNHEIDKIVKSIQHENEIKKKGFISLIETNKTISKKKNLFLKKIFNKITNLIKNQ